MGPPPPPPPPPPSLFPFSFPISLPIRRIDLMVYADGLGGQHVYVKAIVAGDLGRDTR